MPAPLSCLTSTGASGVVGRGLLEAAQRRFHINTLAVGSVQDSPDRLHVAVIPGVAQSSAELDERQRAQEGIVETLDAFEKPPGTTARRRLASVG